MRKSVVLILLQLFFATQVSFSENKKAIDYIITNSNDTLYGVVSMSVLKETPISIEFVLKEGQNKVKYTAKQIKEFTCAGNLYKSKAVQSTVNGTLATNNYFLSVYNLGKVNLYGFSDAQNEKKYFIEKNDSIIELIYAINIVLKDTLDNNSGLVEKKNLKYRWQLKYFLHEMPQLYSLIDQADYYYKDLIEIVKKYNLQFAENVGYVSPKAKEKTTVNFGITMGATLGSLKFKTNDYTFDYLEKTDFISKISPSIGIHVEYRFPIFNHRLSLYQELLYNSYKFESEYVSATNVYNKTIFDLSYLKESNVFRYVFFEKKSFSTYLGGGLGASFALETNNEHIRKHPDMDEISEKAIGSFRRFQLLALASAGVRLKHVTFNYQMEFGNGVSELKSLKSNFLTHNLALQYSF